MKSFKYFILAIVFTAIILAYIWQQIEVIKLSYEIENFQKQVVASLDQNRVLRYNIASLGSLERLAEYVTCRNPNLTESVKLRNLIQVKPVKVTSQITGKRPLFNFFIPTAEASAD